MGAVVFVACDKDDEEHMDDVVVDYEVHIHSPNAEMKMLNDMIHLHVEFHDHNGGIVHHANVKIYEDGNPDNIVFNGPDEAHVHEESGTYELHADFMLNADNGIEAHKDYVLEAKVWGHEAGTHEKMETVTFHVHEM